MKRIFLILLIIFSDCLVFAEYGNAFVFAQVRYRGNWDPYPYVWKDILNFLLTTTSIEVYPERVVVDLSDDKIFSLPFLIMLGRNDFSGFSRQEKENLRRFIDRGGMLFIDDSSGWSGADFSRIVQQELNQIFPEAPLRPIPPDYPIFRSYYLLRAMGGRLLVKNYLLGSTIAGRPAIIYSYNDLLGAWARDRLGNYLWECQPGGETQRFAAQQLTLNIIMYALCGTYKADAVHQPYIQEKLRQ